MLFDAHGDILTDMYQQIKKGTFNSFKKRHVDMYKKAGITHSIFVNWTNPATDNKNEFNEIFEAAFTELQFNSDIIKVCLDYNDLINAPKEDKIGVIIGIEGIKQLKDVAHLRELYKKGVRHASLTWNDVNKYASGLDNMNTRGITEQGFEILKEMEHLGMIIDLAHLNEKSFDDVINFTKGPVIISHGNTKALCGHRRNYTDKQLQMIKDKNGVIGICGIGAFISSNESMQTVEEMANHIDHVVNTIGIDHVGLGLDICYYLNDNVTSNKVDGLQNIGDAQNVIEALRKLGYNESDIEKIAYKNFFRVLKEVLG